MQETVLITGGSGLVGSRLSHLLMAKGYAVRHMSRSLGSSESISCFHWNIKSMEYDANAIIGVEYIIHLAGANVAEGRWTTKRKQQIEESRIKGSQLVCEMVESSNGAIKGVVSSSAVGYYGAANERAVMTEGSPAGKDFLARVCTKWEEAISLCNTNLVILRTGVVLSKKGGAISKLLTPIKMGLGTALGKGTQPMPWVHIDDLCNMYIYAMENRISGVYNAVSPEIISNDLFTEQLAKVVSRKILLPNTPSWVLKLMLGEMADMLLTGVNVSSEKIKEAGFKWNYPSLKEALSNILQR